MLAVSILVYQAGGRCCGASMPLYRFVKIRPRKACNYPNLRSIRWISYDKVGVLYSGKLGNRSARGTCLRSQKLFGALVWWNRIKLRLYEGKESEYSPRTCSIGRSAVGTLCPRPIPLPVAEGTGLPSDTFGAVVMHYYYCSTYIAL